MPAPIEHPTHDIYYSANLHLVFVLVERATGKSTTLCYQNNELSERMRPGSQNLDPFSVTRDKIMKCETILYIVDNDHRVYKQDITLKKTSLTWEGIDAIRTPYITGYGGLHADVYRKMIANRDKYRDRNSDAIIYVGKETDRIYPCFLGPVLHPKPCYSGVISYTVDDIRVRIPTHLAPDEMKLSKFQHNHKNTGIYMFSNIMHMFENLFRGNIHTECVMAVVDTLSSRHLFSAIPRGYNDIDIITCD
jgi:hypothetical protein